jgi:hypothetical protein
MVDLWCVSHTREVHQRDRGSRRTGHLGRRRRTLFTLDWIPRSSFGAWCSSALCARAGVGFALGALLRLLEAVGFTLQRDDLGSVHEPVDEGDHTGGVGEDLVPFADDFVGAEQNGATQQGKDGRDAQIDTPDGEGRGRLSAPWARIRNTAIAEEALGIKPESCDS